MTRRYTVRWASSDWQTRCRFAIRTLYQRVTRARVNDDVRAWRAVQ